MSQEFKRVNTFKADGQQYEIRWGILDDSMIRFEVYKSPQIILILAIEFPGQKEFIENEYFCLERAKKIEKIIKGEGLTLKDITE